MTVGTGFLQSACGDLVQRFGQMPHRAVDVVPLFQAKQSNAEGLEVRPFVTLQRHTSGGLQAHGGELAGVLDTGVGGVTHHHTGGLETVGCHAGEAA